MRLVVTGASGFIGANLARKTFSLPDLEEFIAIDDLSSGFAGNLEGTVALLRVESVLNREFMARALERADALVHLAAVPSVSRSLKDPMRTHHANATGTLAVLEAARGAGVQHVIVASSSSVYGTALDLPKRETARPIPVSPYAVSKLATESYALAYAHSFGLNVLALRFFNVFGPLQTPGHAYAAVVPAFIEAALAGRPLQIQGDGEQTRDFTYVGAVVDVILDAIKRRVTCDSPVNLAYGTRTSINDLADRIEKLIGHKLERQYVEPRTGDVRDSQADSSLLRSLFPDIEPVHLDDGLQATLDWFTNGGPRRQR